MSCPIKNTHTDIDFNSGLYKSIPMSENTVLSYCVTITYKLKPYALYVHFWLWQDQYYL